MKKVAKIAGIIGLTLAGLLGLLALYGVVIEALVPASLLGDGRANVGTWDSGYVSTMGTWVIDQERHMSPLNASEIRCYRDQRECYEAQASIFSGYLTPALERYPISRWDASSIEFSNNLPCVIYTYVIDRATQKLSGRRLKKQAPPGECGLILQDDLRLSFVNGLDVVNQLRREKAPTTVFLIIGTAFTLLMLAWMWKVIRRKSIRVEDDARPVSSSGRRDRQLR